MHPDRDAEHLVEHLIHERLLDLAFADRPLRLLCPYDAAALGTDVLDGARSCHPWVAENGRPAVPTEAGASTASVDVFSAPLSPPRPGPQVGFTRRTPPPRRGEVRSAAVASGVVRARLDDLVLAVNEIATNAVTHGGTRGAVRCWGEGGRFVCEVAGGGTSPIPWSGAVDPTPTAPAAGVSGWPCSSATSSRSATPTEARSCGST